MKIERIPVGPFEMNCFVVHADNGSDCILIDPGDEINRIFNYISQNKLNPVYIFNTHSHIDHVRRVNDVQSKYDIPIHLCEDDLPLLESLPRQSMMFGIDVSPVPENIRFVKDGDEFSIGAGAFKILQTPGHSPGSICLLFNGHVFVGDVLFKDSIGRTDLYGGNYNQLIDSIKNRLFTLPDNTIVYPGHGPTTTIGYEKEHNPFLNQDYL